MEMPVVVDDRISAASPPTEAGDADALRAGTYRLLAQLLAAPPNADLLETLEKIEDTAYEEDDRAGTMAGSWQTLKLAGRRATVESIGNEYGDLFIGLVRGELVPYGSWYMTGFLLDQPLAVLRRDLAELGIVRRQEIHEPEDHISALCEAMSLVIETPEIPVEVQRKFFSSHLAPWVIRFFGDLQQAKSAGFYRAVGLFGERFFELESRYLSLPR